MTEPKKTGVTVRFLSDEESAAFEKAKVRAKTQGLNVSNLIRLFIFRYSEGADFDLLTSKPKK